MQLITKETITSLELVEQINYFRKQEGKLIELRHDTLLTIIRDEFQKEISLQKILESTYKNSRGKFYPMFILTLSQAKQVLVRESKFVRRAIIQYLEKLEEQQAIKNISSNSSIMIPADKIEYWQQIRELSEKADKSRDEIYLKLNLLSTMVVKLTSEVDKLSGIVFEAEYCINKLEGKDMNLNNMIQNR